MGKLESQPTHLHLMQEIHPTTTILSPESMSEQDHTSPQGPGHSPVARSHRAESDNPSDSAEALYSPRRGHAYKRLEDPPRNDEGKMICKFADSMPECRNLGFDRKCEWSKHMDKHDRPYKCRHKGCEKLQGFTYSGGLLRHEREVHKLHGGTKKSLFCPHADCKRSSGTGFTRKENLAEHVRRVHRTSSGPNDLSIVSEAAVLEANPPPPPPPPPRVLESPEVDEPGMENVDPALRKRKRPASINGHAQSRSDDDADMNPSDLRAEIKRLKGLMKEKDDRLLRLEATVERLELNQAQSSPHEKQNQLVQQQNGVTT